MTIRTLITINRIIADYLSNRVDDISKIDLDDVVSITIQSDLYNLVTGENKKEGEK